MSADIKLEGLTKKYGSVVALDRFTHTFEKSKIHALMGKNGCGKSTLIKMLAGAVQPTHGSIELGGKQCVFQSPSDALAASVVTVHQELSLVPHLSVVENIFLGRLSKKAIAGIQYIHWASARDKARCLLEEMGLDIDPNAIVDSLSVGQQQTVEIAKAMSLDPVVLLLDEPTSALASKEVEMLFAALRRLRERGVTMIYITHRMSELAEIADTVTVLRDGRHIDSVEMSATTPEGIVDLMFGDVASQRHHNRGSYADLDRPVLEVMHLNRAPVFSDISFRLYRGEVLGIAGMLGAGRTEVLRSIFGADALDSGEIIFNGQKIDAPNPRLMSGLGLGYTPENRKEVGLIQEHSIHSNLSLASLRQNAPHGLISKASERPGVALQVDKLQIKIGDSADKVSSLSGGNQQKVVIGNWLNISPRVMFFDEPSRGVDVQAKQQIFNIIWDQAKRGVSSIFVSTELEEILDVCDRILVMKEGRILGEISPKDTTLSQLYTACMEGI